MTLDLLEQRRLLAAFTVDLAQPEDASNFHTISAAVAAAGVTAETDDTIDVVAGSYTENVIVDTPVTLRGAQFATTAVGRTGQSETILTGSFSVTAAGVTVSGFTILNGSSVGDPPTIAAVYVAAPDATITNNILTGATGVGTGISVTAAVDSGTTTIAGNVLEAFATGAAIRSGGATAISDSVLQGNAVTGITFNLTAATNPSTATVSGNTFDNDGVPQITLEGGTETEDLVTLSNSTVALRGAATWVSEVAPTPLAGISDAAFTLYRSTNEDVTLLIDLDVDGSGFGTYDHVALAGSASADQSIITYIPTANFNGPTSFSFTTMDGATGVVLISVVPVNDAPTASATIPPQSVIAGQTGNLAASDFFADVDTNDSAPDVLTFSLSGAPAFVTIVPETGAIAIAPAAGLADVGEYTFDVGVTDGTESASQTVSLSVLRANNAAPVFTNLSATVTLAEDATGVVGTYTATDAENDDIVYSIVAGNEAGKFAIDSATGEVTLIGALDAETATSYTLTIRATDDGEPEPAFVDGTLTVNVTDVNEAAGSVSITGPSNGFETATLTFTAVALDPDVGASFSYRWFVDDVEQAGQTGAIFSIAFPGPGSHVIGVEVIDRAGDPVTATKTVSVLDAPPEIPLSLSTGTVNEGAPVTLTIGRISDPTTGDVAEVGQLVVDWGDGTYTIINSVDDPTRLAQVQAGTPVAIPHTYDDGANAAKSITVRIWDNSAQAHSATTSVIVNNVAPTGNFVALTPSIQTGSPALVNWFSQTDVSAADRTAGLRYTFAIDGNGNGLYDVGETLIAGDGTYGGSIANSQYTIPGSFFETAGSYSILGLIFDKDSTPFVTRQTNIIVAAGPLRVISLGGDHSGFTIVFNQKVDKSTINIYDGTDASVDASDIILTRAGGQVVRGSVIWAADGKGFDFVNTGGILPAGTYNVTLRSASNAFKDLNGGLLDGDGNGSAGGNFVSTFGVNAPPGPVLSTVDFARGPGQSVDVIPSNSNSDLPVMVNTPVTITSINFQIRYDASLLTIRAPDPANGILDVYAGANLPAGWAVDYALGINAINVSLTKTTPTTADITAGSKELIKIRATVPNDPGIYGKSHYISFANIVVNGNNSIEGTADRSVHKVVFLGDANMDGTVNVADAALMQSIVLGQVNGFDKYELIDPAIIVDSSRNNAVDSQDATNAVLSGFTGGRPGDVPAFTPITLPASIGADPTFSVGQVSVNAAGANNIAVPISIIDDARGVQAGAIRVNYDPTKLDLADVSPFTSGTLLGTGWATLTNVNEAQGYVEIAFYSGTALSGTSALTGSVGSLKFAAMTGAADGTTPITIGTPSNQATSPTVFFDRQGGLLATSAVNGAVTLDTTLPTTVGPATFAYAGTVQSVSVTFSEDVSATISALAFELLNQTTGATIALTLSSISSDGRTVTLRFTNTGGVKNNVLPTGNYRLRVVAGQVSDVAGNVLAANADSPFFFLNADADHNRTVNFDDLLALARNYNKTSNVNFSDGDFDYDGDVDFDDLLILARTYNQSLSAPAAAAAAAAAEASTASETTTTRKRATDSAGT